MRLILYSKPGCHLCEGLQEKLEQIQSFPLELEVRDITTRDDWFQSYQYEVPVLFLDRSQELTANGQASETGASPSDQTLKPNLELTVQLIPRPSPRASVAQLEQLLRKYLIEVQ